MAFTICGSDIQCIYLDKGPEGNLESRTRRENRRFVYTVPLFSSVKSRHSLIPFRLLDLRILQAGLTDLQTHPQFRPAYESPREGVIPGLMIAKEMGFILLPDKHSFDCSALVCKRPSSLAITHKSEATLFGY